MIFGICSSTALLGWASLDSVEEEDNNHCSEGFELEGIHCTPLIMVPMQEAVQEKDEVVDMDEQEVTYKGEAEVYDVDVTWEFEIFSKILGMAVKGHKYKIIKLMKIMKGLLVVGMRSQGKYFNLARL